MRRTVYNEVDPRQSLAVAARSANTTVNGTAVDADGYRSIMVVGIAGGITDGTHTIGLEDSDDGSTAWANVNTDDLQGSAPAFAAASQNTVAEFGMIQLRRRWLRVKVTTAGATTGGTTGGIILLSGPRQKPTPHQA
jgi:hypothetical protein